MRCVVSGMSSRFNQIKISLVILGLILCILPFKFNHKEEVLIGLVILVILLLLRYQFLPRHNIELKDKLIETEIHNALLKSQLDELIVSIPEPLAIIDNNLNILLSNLGFRQLLKLNQSHLKEVDHSIKTSLNQAVLSSGSTRNTIYVDEREFLMVSNHLTYNNKLSTLLLFNDVTALVENQKAQKRFVADASHELKTPITAIKGMSEILLTRQVDQSTTLEFTQQINKEAKRLQSIVSDLLEISKLSSNRLILNYSSFNFSDLIKDVYHSLKTQLISKNLNFIYDFAPKYVYLDYDKMHQVMTNLLANAISYSDQGKISLSVKINDKQIEINLTDQGIGIDAKHIKFLFDRFYRIDAARHRSLGGSGLGLSIVHEIVEAHKGNINVISEVGKGSQFIIVIPY